MAKLYYENSLRHAANKKYIAKTPLGNGKYRYFYTQEEYDAFMGVRDKISRTGMRPNTKYFDKKIDDRTDKVVYVEKKGGLEQMNRDADASLRLLEQQKYGTNARIDRSGRNESARSKSTQTVPEKNRRTITRTQEEAAKAKAQEEARRAAKRQNARANAETTVKNRAADAARRAESDSKKRARAMQKYGTVTRTQEENAKKRAEKRQQNRSKKRKRSVSGVLKSFGIH